MKRFILFLLASGMTATVFAQVDLPEHQFAVGTWEIIEGRVFQKDAAARLAKANVKAPQSGAMLYEFDVRYESGLEDGQGGFGVHIFADTVISEPSWGVGKSWLLWLNYDKIPLKNSGIQAGLSGQVYRSINDSAMELVQSVDLNHYEPLFTQDGAPNLVSFKIYANGDTGEIRVYDPTDSTGANYYYFTIDKKYLPLTGDWVAFRTNGVSLSFAPVGEAGEVNATEETGEAVEAEETGEVNEAEEAGEAAEAEDAGEVNEVE
ncbi:MAG: hypothetical protein LBD58_02825 [Treponema sp.]|jgi:hypothetical protein|nr:hypothetical protein [Treponema sp.]